MKLNYNLSTISGINIFSKNHVEATKKENEIIPLAVLRMISFLILNFLFFNDLST